MRRPARCPHASRGGARWTVAPRGSRTGRGHASESAPTATKPEASESPSAVLLLVLKEQPASPLLPPGGDGVEVASAVSYRDKSSAQRSGLLCVAELRCGRTSKGADLAGGVSTSPMAAARERRPGLSVTATELWQSRAAERKLPHWSVDTGSVEVHSRVLVARAVTKGQLAVGRPVACASTRPSTWLQPHPRDAMLSLGFTRFRVFVFLRCARSESGRRGGHHHY
jgi:hypothetical protein